MVRTEPAPDVDAPDVGAPDVGAPDVGEPTASGPAAWRGILMWVAIVALVASAIVASNAFSLRDRLLGAAAPKPAPPVASRALGAPTGDTVPAPAPATSLRSQPWWQDVTTLDGNGASTEPAFTISDSAIQWRVIWSCGTGHLLVQAPKRSKAVVDGVCPGGGPGYAVQTGQVSLQVTADGPWHLKIAQEIDAPLVEPRLPAMTLAGTSAVGTGSFYGIDQTGTGTATLYHQADGRYSLRLENFFVSPTTDLELRMSTVGAPHSSKEVLAAKSELVATLDVTAGSLNFVVPATVDPTQFRSLYVWCALTQSAYSAVTLAPTR